MKREKPYSKEFLESGIKVGSWVYLHAFEKFGVVANIIPRVRHRMTTRVEELCDVPDACISQFVVAPPIVVLSRIGYEQVIFGENDSSRYCATHCQLVTQDLLHQFLGQKIAKIQEALSVIRL